MSAEDRPIHLAYLASEYPATSLTFVLREVRALRAMNFAIATAAINRPSQRADLTTAEREETAGTFFIKQVGVGGAARAHMRTIASMPLAYLRGLRFALGLGGGKPTDLLYSMFYFTEALVLGLWLQDQGTSHLHVHFANPASMVGLIASRVFGVGFSLTVHGPDEFFDIHGQHLAEKIAGAAFVICIGTFARSQLMKIAPPSSWHKFAVVPLGVDPEIFRPRPAPTGGESFNLLCVGRLVPAKGQHILLAALDRLTKSGRKVNLCLVGDGPDRASLEREARCRGLAGHVTFAGAVNQDQIRQYYGAANAFVLPSFAEGIPVVLMEAMAMEIPCVSTMIAGVPELIRDGIDGLLVMPSDDRALAHAIERLIDDEGLRHRLALAGRRRVLEKYNLSENIVTLAGLFRARLESALRSAGCQPAEED
jgi:colanic acid/amylovoran biosynthesis glycosyltransferase